MILAIYSIHKLSQYLSRSPSVAIIDGARDTSLAEKLLELGAYSLYTGQLARREVECAPYVLSCDSGIALNLIHDLVGSAILIVAGIDPDLARQHFRRFTVASIPGGIAGFRFFDPRVFRPFMRCSTVEQVSSFFGPVDYFLVESLNSPWLDEYRFSNQSKSLSKKQLYFGENE